MKLQSGYPPLQSAPPLLRGKLSMSGARTPILLHPILNISDFTLHLQLISYEAKSYVLNQFWGSCRCFHAFCPDSGRRMSLSGWGEFRGPSDTRHLTKHWRNNIFHPCVEASEPEYLGHSSSDWSWHSICHHYSIFCLPARCSYSCMNVSDRMKTDEDRWLIEFSQSKLNSQLLQEAAFFFFAIHFLQGIWNL